MCACVCLRVFVCECFFKRSWASGLPLEDKGVTREGVGINKQELNIKLSLENTNGLVVIIQEYYVKMYQCKSCENSKWI